MSDETKFKYPQSALAKNRRKNGAISSIENTSNPAQAHDEVEHQTEGASHGTATNEGPPQGSFDIQPKPFYERFIKRKNNNGK